MLFDARAGDLLPHRLRLVFGTGFCSSFTTYSTFVVDAVTSTPGVGLAYVLASYGCGFAAIGLSRVVVGTVGPVSVGRPARGDD